MIAMEFSTLDVELRIASQTLSQHKIERLKQTLHRAYVRRFKTCSTPKYGTLNMVFKDEELREFFRHVASQKFKLIFKFQAYMGLRVGEAVRIRLDDIDFEGRELTIDSEKTRVKDVLRIPAGLFRELGEFVSIHQREIAEAQGYIFFKGNDNNRNRRLHVNKDYARKMFRQARDAAGLSSAYGVSEESCDNHRRRQLYRLGTHSLRRYAITRFHRVSRDIVMTSRYARHLDTTETVRYIENNRAVLYANIDVAFKVDVMQRQLNVL